MAELTKEMKSVCWRRIQCSHPMGPVKVEKDLKNKQDPKPETLHPELEQVQPRQLFVAPRSCVSESGILKSIAFWQK